MSLAHAHVVVPEEESLQTLQRRIEELEDLLEDRNAEIEELKSDLDDAIYDLSCKEEEISQLEDEHEEELEKASADLAALREALDAPWDFRVSEIVRHIEEKGWRVR